MYRVIHVNIENGVFTTANYGRTRTQKAFLADKDIKEKFKVVGWSFPKVHLVWGNQENGEGWAFVK